MRVAGAPSLLTSGQPPVDVVCFPLMTSWCADVCSICTLNSTFLSASGTWNISCTSAMHDITQLWGMCITGRDRAFWFAKNNFDSIRFNSRQKIDSNRLVLFDSPTHGRNPGGGGLAGPCTAWSLAKYGCPTAQYPHRPHPGRKLLHRLCHWVPDCQSRLRLCDWSRVLGNRIDSNSESE